MSVYLTWIIENPINDRQSQPELVAVPPVIPCYALRSRCIVVRRSAYREPDDILTFSRKNQRRSDEDRRVASRSFLSVFTCDNLDNKRAEDANEEIEARRCVDRTRSRRPRQRDNTVIDDFSRHVGQPDNRVEDSTVEMQLDPN